MKPSLMAFGSNLHFLPNFPNSPLWTILVSFYFLSFDLGMEFLSDR
jgi:hypothetical protein